MRRWKLSPAQRADMWSRWKAGESLHAIGRALGKDHVVVQLLLARRGGITPATRRHSPITLTLPEREDISRGIASGQSLRAIAQRLSRAPSTISRTTRLRLFSTGGLFILDTGRALDQHHV